MSEETALHSELPERGSAWQAGDGWNQLIPGRSTIAQIRSAFGEPDGEERLSNADAFDYWDGLLRFVFLDSDLGETERVLSVVHISARAAEKAGLPQSFELAQKYFGKLQAQDFDKRLSICIYEGAGIRVACDESQTAPRIRWYEFF